MRRAIWRARLHYAHKSPHMRAHALTPQRARARRYPEADYYAASANGSLLGFPLTAPDARALWASVEASRGIFRPCAPLIAPEAPRPLTNESH
jgi:hypothetical protein